MRRILIAVCVLASGCASAGAGAPDPVAPSAAAADSTPLPGLVTLPNADPFPSTYQAAASRPVLIRNATLLTAAGPAIRGGSILLQDGRIAAVGTNITAPAGAEVIDAGGRYVTPGLIDTHSHAGDYPAPGVAAHSDGNEATSPVTAHVWAEHSIWPQDPQFPRILAGGTTTLQVLPGSANLIGGRSVVVKVVPSRTVQGMKFPGARYGLKMACGENPKRVYASRGPATRMGNVAGYRAAWIEAQAYRQRWDRWLADRKGDAPTRNLGLETLADVLRGNIYVHNHCYRADEMAQMIDIAREFGYRIRSFHHGVEAYKVADLLARDSISASIWADWGGFKMEALDATRANLALVHAAGARAIVHSDDPTGAQRLNQDAAKGMAAGRAVGIEISEEDAIRWITLNAAWALGIDDKVGSLEAGKNADVVLWSANPFSVYAKPDRVWIDGVPLYDRSDTSEGWRTDFELGYIRTRGGN
ncbi:MAG TPA: amidohydrolase [Longimicrobiales bacterium]|nr:amidohydrolase [Longimicrobiales bacterium]